MSEVIVKLNEEEFSDSERLSCALDAYVEWCEENQPANDVDPFSDFMMTTEFNGACKSRKLIFHDKEHASRFLLFWSTQKDRIPTKKFEY